jgi:plasmid stabilization system protein ParE
MSRLELTPLANRDVLDIATAIAAERPRSAERFLSRLDHLFGLLAKHPLMGSNIARRSTATLADSRSTTTSFTIVRRVMGYSSFGCCTVLATRRTWFSRLLSNGPEAGQSPSAFAVLASANRSNANSESSSNSHEIVTKSVDASLKFLAKRLGLLLCHFESFHSDDI